MPNHFHIFIHQTTAELLGSKFIGALTNSYTKSINKKYKRSGVLFQGRTNNKIVYNEDNFKQVVKYILLNPVNAGLVKKFDEWKYSSAKGLIMKEENSITDRTIINYFSCVDEFIEYIESDDYFDIEEIRRYLFG